MQKHERLALAAVEAELKKWGCASAPPERSSQDHLKVPVTKGQRFLGYVVISCSPRSADACVSQCRRAARRIAKGDYYG